MMRLETCDPPPEPHTLQGDPYTASNGNRYQGIVAGDGEYYERAEILGTIQWYRLVHPDEAPDE